MHKEKQSYLTILVISVGFLAIFFLKDWRWAAWVSLAVGVTGIVSPFLSRKIHYLWMKLADILGWFMPKLILGLIFFLFLFPLSLLATLFGKKDHLQLKPKTGTTSTYLSFNRLVDKSYFEKPW